MECHGGRAAERAQPRAGNTLESLSRAANTPSQDGEPRSDCEEEESAAAEFRDAPRVKSSDPKRGSSFVANRLAEEPPRLNFQIPRRNKEKRGAFILRLCLRFKGLIFVYSFWETQSKTWRLSRAAFIQLTSRFIYLFFLKKTH